MSIRADRRLTKLIAHYEGLLESADEAVSLHAAEKLGDILMKQLELKDKQAERQLKLDLAELRAWVPPATAPAPALVPAPTPQSLAETIRQLQQEIDAKAAARGKQQTDEEQSFFD
jgi:hypothetical protein